MHFSASNFSASRNVDLILHFSLHVMQKQILYLPIDS